MKMFKKIKILNLFILGIFIINTGCERFPLGNEFLSQPPELKYSIDSVFVNAIRARELLWNLYSTLPYGHGWGKENEGNRLGPAGFKAGINDGGSTGAGYCVPIWSMTDLMRFRMGTGTMAEWIKGTISAQNAGNRGKFNWNRRLIWQAVRTGYIFIDNIDRVPDMSAAEKALLKAEAKIIIATHYVEFFNFYGGILYINHAYDPNEEIGNVERLTVMQTVDTLTAIIDEAIEVLPFELDDPAVWSGRITSAAAMGVKIKLLKMAASPLFNSDQPYMEGEAATKELVWTGGYKIELWQKLRDACKELIDLVEASSYYEMVNTGNPELDYRKAYYERTGETLFSTRVTYQFSLRPDIIRNQHWWADVIPLHNYAMKFPMKNGMSIENPVSGYDPANPYYNRDPRLYETLLLNGRPYTYRKGELYAGGLDRLTMDNIFAYYGYRLWKWKLDIGGSGYPLGVQWSYFRIPDLYLLYAEALNELNNGPTAEAFDYVNRVRARVQVGPIEDFIGKPQNEVTKQEFLAAVLNERVLELGCENTRWDDMVRYKMEDVFKAKDIRMNITLKVPKETFNFMNVGYDQHDQYFTYEIVEEPNMFKWATEFSPKYYLDPIPFSELQKNYGLIQNPGWEL